MIRIVFFCLLSVSFSGTKANSVNIDLSGFDYFVKIYHSLENGIEPNLAAWDSLFHTPGYREIQLREKKRPILTSAYRISFKPELRAKRDSILKTNSYLSYLVAHLVQFQSKYKSVIGFRDNVLASLSFDRTLLIVRNFIDDKIVKDNGLPPVSFIIFAPDGRGYSNRIVADVLHIKDEKNLSGFFAHEFFHFYFSKIEKSGFINDSVFSPLSNRLYYMYEEGLADMTDKQAVPFMSENDFNSYAREQPYLRLYRKAYLQEVPPAIQLMDSLLSAFGSDPERNSLLAMDLNKRMPLEGRPLGAYMAKAILDHKGVSAYAVMVKDWFLFFTFYNEAAKVQNKPVLSAKSMRFLQNMRESQENKTP